MNEPQDTYAAICWAWRLAEENSGIIHCVSGRDTAWVVQKTEVVAGECTKISGPSNWNTYPSVLVFHLTTNLLRCGIVHAVASVNTVVAGGDSGLDSSIEVELVYMGASLSWG